MPSLTAGNIPPGPILTGGKKTRKSRPSKNKTKKTKRRSK